MNGPIADEIENNHPSPSNGLTTSSSESPELSEWNTANRHSEEWNAAEWNSAEWHGNPITAQATLAEESKEGSSLLTQVMVGILLMRSALDLYSGKGLPAAFAIAVDLLVIAFIGRQFILRRPIHTDRFWWVLMAWVALQGIWVALLPLGGLGGTAFMTYEAMREWVRFFSLGMVYLLTMQLRDRISPDRLASILMLSLAIPLFLAALQLGKVVPSFLESDVGWKDFEGTGDRINSTLGHYNSFATFTLLFISLTLWRLQMSRWPWGWALLLGCLLYCLVATKSLTGLVMLMVFGGLYFLPRLKGKGIFGALALVVTLGVLLSTELGQERLLELNKTPLLNPDLTFQHAAVLQAADIKEFRNSFNWRLLQWRDLLLNWRQHPWLGYGLATTKELSVFNTTSHNDYMRFLLEGGIIGLGLFLTFLAAQVTRTVQAIRRSLPGSPQRALAQTLFPFSVALIVGMAAGNVMVHTATFFYWWVLLALLGWDWPDRFGGRPGRSRQLHLQPTNQQQSNLQPKKRMRPHRTASGQPIRQRQLIAKADTMQTSPSVAAQPMTPAMGNEARNFDLELNDIAFDAAARDEAERPTPLFENTADDTAQAYDDANGVTSYDTDLDSERYDTERYDDDIYQSDRYDLDGDI
ncbi:MAG: O-antigen ligase family protein [Phormidesmis sp.]